MTRKRIEDTLLEAAINLVRKVKELEAAAQEVNDFPRNAFMAIHSRPPTTHTCAKCSFKSYFNWSMMYMTLLLL